MNALECQNALYDVFKKLNNLKFLYYDLDGLILTKQFYEGISELSNIQEMKLNLKSFDIGLFKAWSTTGLSKVIII
jgi:hypothetical protein